MTLTQLRYLVALADHRHFGKAADSCAISQPTLSAQLRKLEQELSATLIERGKAIGLTPIGEAVVSRARGILSESDEIIGIARRGEEPLAGPRRIGIIPTVCPYLLPWALPALKQAFPRLDLICREAVTHEVMQAIRVRELDWGIIAEDPDDPALRATALFHEPFFAALPQGHILTAEPAISQAHLAQEKMLVLSEGHCLRDQTLSLFTVGRKGGDDIRATSLETLRGLVAAGHGLTLIPAMARRAGDAGLELRPLTPPASRTLYLISRRADPRRDEAKALAETLRNAAPETTRPL